MPSPPRRPGRTPPHRGPPRARRARPLPALLAVALVLGAQLAATGLVLGAPPGSLAAATGGAARTASPGGAPAPTPPPPPPPACTYADTACAAGSTCPGGTAVSAECADRSAFDENPCVCTALQELAALSDTLQAEAPWTDLASAAYCQNWSLRVECAMVYGVRLPTRVFGRNNRLAGALPPSLGDLGPFVRFLTLAGNAITSLPTELGDLSGLTFLGLEGNQLTGVPTEFRTWGPSDACRLSNNDPGFSCANVGAGTTCCTGATGTFGAPGNNCGEGLPGGPCYTAG